VPEVAGRDFCAKLRNDGAADLPQASTSHLDRARRQPESRCQVDRSRDPFAQQAKDPLVAWCRS
jgi:archaeosine-15-forming tRNA-guanine transglycosylase